MTTDCTPCGSPSGGGARRRVGGWVIGPAAPDDAAKILALQRLAYRSEAALYGDDAIPPMTQTLGELAAEFADHVILKAVLDGAIVGSVRARVDGDTCHVGRLMVRPDCEGNGIGAALMAAVEAACNGVARYRLFIGNRSLRNLALYERLGYRPVDGACRPAACGDAVSLVWMEKPARTT